MSRIARTLIDCACYHIVTRGNRRQRIFKNDEDFTTYLKIMKKAKRKYSISIYSYCLMLNHVHLLIETESACNISKFMHWINRGYAAYFNSKYKKVGHLWQGRFKSKPILKGEYLIHCATYIEGNPVKTGIVDDMGNYKWRVIENVAY